MRFEGLGHLIQDALVGSGHSQRPVAVVRIRGCVGHVHAGKGWLRLGAGGAVPALAGDVFAELNQFGVLAGPFGWDLVLAGAAPRISRVKLCPAAFVR